MSWRVSICFVLVVGLWCSTATSQQGLPRPQGNVQQITPPGPRTHHAAAKPPAAQRAETPQHVITPRREAAAGERSPRPAKEPFSIGRILGSLILVIAGIFGVAKLFKTLGVGPFTPVGPIPKAACEVLGVMNMPHRHTLYLMRIGQRVLLMGSTGESLTVLSEITEPEEVQALTQLCTAQAQAEPDEKSFFSRLLKHGTSSQFAEASRTTKEGSARQELEARLNAFVQS